MTLINSCSPHSLLHLIVLLATIALTTTTVPADRSQLEVGSRRAAGGDAYDRKSDNKRYDNSFDFKTDVNNLLLLRSRRNLQPSTINRKRRGTIASPLEASSSTSPPPDAAATFASTTENLILNLSFANVTSFSVNFSAPISETVAVLNLSHNSLSHFNASKLTKLKALDLSHNRLSELRINGHDTLQTLDASENSLTAFQCSACESLQALNLSSNQLSNITLDGLPRLTAVDLSSNDLSALEPRLFHNKSNLSDVRLACNRIRAIERDLFHQLTGLRRLDLSFNDISDIDSETFSNLVNLQVFDLSFNRIHIASLQSLQSIADLARLSLAGNVLLRNALRGFAVTWSIMELDYSHVGLCQVPDSLAQSVRILNLYGNFVNVSIPDHPAASLFPFQITSAWHVA
jgi:Leucine-rich repeat (LRR) protein